MESWTTRIRYNRLVANIARKLIKVQYTLGKHDLAIENFQHLANFCTHNYIGTYRWTKLENDLLAIARKKITAPGKQWVRTGEVNNVLHVMTEAYEVGGHTELVAKWIMADPARKHTVIFTRQQVPLPAKITELTGRPGVKVIDITSVPSFTERASTLKEYAFDNDIVVLHNHAHDVLPMLAFAGEEGPPVGMLNNADHVYWVGAAVSDMILHIRSFYQSVDKERRGIGKAAFLPIPISLPGTGNYDEARQELGVKNDQVMLLTIASEYKFKPTPEYNYFENIRQVLDQCPAAIAYVIGVKAGSPVVAGYEHDRLICLGVLADTRKYEIACDIYVESYPFVSYTSLLQTVVRGKACQLVYDPPLLNKCIDDPHFIYPASRDEWRSALVKLITDPAERQKTAALQSAYVAATHLETGKWKNYLEECYTTYTSITHSTGLRSNSPWILTLNEKYLLEMLSNKTVLAGIITSRNIVFRSLIYTVSRMLVWYKKIMVSSSR